MAEQDVTGQTEASGRDVEVEDLEVDAQDSAGVVGGVMLHKSGDPEDGGN